MMPSTDEGRLLRVEDVARILGVTPAWVYRAVKSRQLPHVRVGNRVRFRPAAIDQWIESRHTSV